MGRGEVAGTQLGEIKSDLVRISKSLMYVYSIVAIFACLYFGFMIYLLFIR
jgi:hypothetical protein